MRSESFLSRLNPLRWFSSTPHEVRFVYFNKLIYAYPLVLVSWLLGALNAWGYADPETLAWTWITVAIFVLATIAIDLPRNQTLFLGVFVGFFWLFGNKMAEWGFPIWTHLYDHFAGLDVRYDSGTFQALSELISVGFILNLVYCFIEHRVRINHNEVVVQALLRKVDSVPRLGSVFRMRIPDFLEFLCGAGAGTLEVVRGNRRLVFNDVLFLYPRFPKIDRILDSWAVTEIGAADLDEEEGEAPTR